MKVKSSKSELVQFITDNQESIYRLAYSYVMNTEDALDVVQEAIYKAMKNQSTLRDPNALKRWFYRIIVNTALDVLRKRDKVQPMEDEALNSLIQGSEDHYSDLDLEKNLDDLPENYRIVIVLRFFEDLKIEEVAEVLNENVNTVKARLYKALHFLKVKILKMEGLN